MHYKVRGRLIRSENAALSTKLAHRWVLQQIAAWPCDATVLDYGCGKLRYAIPLARRVQSVVAVDSAEQVDRTQLIDGERTSVREFARNSHNLRAYALQEKAWRRQKFDRILCANVLSAIPAMEERLYALRSIRDLLRPNGCALVLNQHSNSEFGKYKRRSDVMRHLDGYLIFDGALCARFYGIINAESLREACEAAGLHCQKVGVWDQTAYAYVTAPPIAGFKVRLCGEQTGRRNKVRSIWIDERKSAGEARPALQ